jgi:septal ring factor EnvC (AmiA/AmiB activator)
MMGDTPGGPLTAGATTESSSERDTPRTARTGTDSSSSVTSSSAPNTATSNSASISPASSQVFSPGLLRAELIRALTDASAKQKLCAVIRSEVKNDAEKWRATLAAPNDALHQIRAEFAAWQKSIQRQLSELNRIADERARILAC